MKEEKNARNIDRKSSRLGNTIRAAKQRSKSADAEPTIDDIASDVERINTTIRNASANSIDSDANNADRTFSGSGSDGSGNGSGRGAGIDSGRDSDSGTDSNTPRKRGRRSAADRARELAEQTGISIEEATEQIQAQKKPRRVTRLVEEIEPGVTASALLIGAVFEGCSELLAMSVSKSYLKLSKPESFELGDAILQVLDTLPKSTRKRFDKFIAMYYPYWNLAKVVTKVSYPRYMMYKMEQDYAKAAKSQTPTETQSGIVDSREQPTTNSEATYDNVVAHNFG